MVRRNGKTYWNKYACWNIWQAFNWKTISSSWWYQVISDYYNEDLSLSEIAENNNISRQGVRDIIKKGESKLFEYEEKLQIMKKTQENEKTIQLILSQLSKIQDNSSDKKVEKILNEVQKELSCIA